MTDLAALVVTFNRLDQLKLTIAALLAEPADRLSTLVVVNNASTDGTTDWLTQQADPRLDIVEMSTNSGGAGGFAAGIARIKAHYDPDWTLVMDDDARPEPGCLATFHGQDRSVAEAWFAAAYLPDGTIADMNRPWLNPFWHPGAFLRSALTGRDGFHMSSADYAAKTATKVDGGSFVGLFLSRRALGLAGTPDAGLFLYGDDVLYTLGLSAAGGTARFDPNLRYEHDCGTLTGPGPVFRPLWKAYYFHRNQIFVYRKAAGPILFWPVMLLKWVRWRLRAPAYGSDAHLYKKVLSAALSDGLAGRTTRSHADVLGLSG